MRDLPKLKISIIAFILMLAVSAAAIARTGGTKDIQQDKVVISGDVVAILPSIVQLETKMGQINVNVSDINIEKMDVAFLQVGDEMTVDGFFNNPSYFEGQTLVDVEPFSL